MRETNGHTRNGHSRYGLRAMWDMVSRFGLAAGLGSMYNGRRQMYDTLGYKQLLSYQDFKVSFLRQGLAQRLVKAYPESTWASPPKIEEANDTATPTEFEAAWTTLADRLKMYTLLARTDILANLGRYAVLFLGLADQPDDLATPATPVGSQEDVLFLEPYSEEWARVVELDKNRNTANFGKPLLYNITFNRTGGISTTADPQATLPAGVARVHASRVIHIAADDLLDDTVYGIPWLEPLYDHLDDLIKVVGGAAEMFWRDAKRRIVLEMRDDYSLGAEDEQAISDEVEEFQHDFKDFLRVKGMDVKSLAGDVANPKEHFAMLVDLICATRGIPKRIVMGSERGELASTQDERGWNQKVSARQTNIAEPRYLRPLIDRLIMLNALPAMTNAYTVVWPNLLALAPDQQAVVAKDYAIALAQYAGPEMAEQVVPAPEFRETYLGLPAVSPYTPILTPTPTAASPALAAHKSLEPVPARASVDAQAD